MTLCPPVEVAKRMPRTYEHKRHTWKREQSGMRENPGVWSHGRTITYHDECKCGATRVREVSIIGGESGSRTVYTDPMGYETIRDTRRGWRP